MRGRNFILLASLLAVAGISAAAVEVPLNTAPTSNARHWRAGSGPGTKRCQRAAAKRRNVIANRKNHRG